MNKKVILMALRMRPINILLCGVSMALLTQEPVFAARTSTLPAAGGNLNSGAGAGSLNGSAGAGVGSLNGSAGAGVGSLNGSAGAGVGSLNGSAGAGVGSLNGSAGAGVGSLNGSAESANPNGDYSTATLPPTITGVRLEFEGMRNRPCIAHNDTVSIACDARDGGAAHFSYTPVREGEPTTFKITKDSDPTARGFSSMREYCLDVSGGTYKSGARVVYWPCMGGANQQWMMISAGGDKFSLRPYARAGRAFCLDVTGGASAPMGSQLKLAVCSVSPTQVITPLE